MNISDCHQSVKWAVDILIWCLDAIMGCMKLEPDKIEVVLVGLDLGPEAGFMPMLEGTYTPCQFSSIQFGSASRSYTFTGNFSQGSFLQSNSCLLTNFGTDLRQT